MSVSDPEQALPGSAALRFGTPASRVPDVIGIPTRVPSSGIEVPNDCVLESANTDWYALRAASVRGEGKRLSGGHRQDDMRVARLGDDKSSPLIIAVADGVGSSDMSATGARLACQAAIAYAREAVAVYPHDLSGLTGYVRDAMLDWAESEGVDAGRLATTLVAALIEPAAAGGAIARLVVVGDSGASVVSDGEIRAYPDAHDRDEAAQEVFANAPTRALPLVEAPSAQGQVTLESGTALLLWTDGFEPLLQFSESHNYCRDVFATYPPPAIPEFLWMVDARIKSYDDDRTVAAIWIC